MDRWSWSGGENQVELGLATRWIWEDPEGNGEWVAAARWDKGGIFRVRLELIYI